MNDIQETIIRKIKEGHVHMQPKWHFVLRTTLLVLGTIITALLAVYLFSFILFALRKSGIVFAPGFGFHGFVFFIASSPWLLILLVGIFLLTLYLLVKHYAFSYRRPLVYSMLAVVLFVVGASSALHALAMHERIGAFAERNNIPGMAPFYKTMADKRPDGVTLGVVADVNEDGLTLTTEDDESLSVRITKETRQRRGVSYDVDDVVLVFGDRDGDTITAFGIRPVSDDPMFPRPNGRGQGMMRGQGKFMMSPPREIIPVP